ncbi:hypothetical protein TI39_contig452g00001 [Lecanosticta acicola]|uniref:Uncharacterized protein n=1 Tax=Lecanosticta acicola TaxID=111012 RepID=A0AAI8Z2H5_9PEZI|nr:hypothetical protein TI39_contig452g00001 [Lecanosticta acicola]
MAVEYEKLATSDSEDQNLAEWRGLHEQQQQHRGFRLRPDWIAWLLLLVITNTASLLWTNIWSWSSLDHLKALTVWSPLHSTLPYQLHTIKLDVMTHTDAPSLWRADPSPAVDKLWKDNWDSRPLVIPVGDLAKLGQDPDYAVRWPTKNSSLTVVGNHAHHLLHCLDELRRSVWADYYWPQGNLNPFYRNHQMHCIDMLRQDLMCRVPRDVYPLIWQATETTPQPDFNITMKCASWEDMWAWWAERQLTEEQTLHEEPVKPVGAKEWPAPAALREENSRLKDLCSEPGIVCSQGGMPVEWSHEQT